MSGLAGTTEGQGRRRPSLGLGSGLRQLRRDIDPRHPTKFYEPHYARAEITVFSIGGFIFFALGWFLIIGHTIQTVPMG